MTEERGPEGGLKPCIAIPRPADPRNNLPPINRSAGLYADAPILWGARGRRLLGQALTARGSIHEAPRESGGRAS